MSDISLYLDQDNELRFNVSIEGSKPGAPKYRLVFEGKDLSYSFQGRQSAAGEVSFVIPTMKNIIKEGNYRANLEVMVDDRYFTPLTFDAQFEESVKVTAESISRPVQKKIGVSAAIISSTAPKPERIVESTPVKKEAKIQSDFVGTIGGKKITADDLRNLIRSGGLT